MENKSTRKRALLIGVNDYHVLPSLRYARNDAEAFGEMLVERCGFEDHQITLMTCQSEGGTRALARFVETSLLNLSDDGELELMVFGFWGHGFAPSPGRRYLCGMDTTENDVERSAISLDLVKAKLAQVCANDTLIVLDCCQNQPAGRSTGSATLSEGEEAAFGSLARDIQAARVDPDAAHIPTVALLNSCREGQRAYEWDARGHGIFTAHLLDGLHEGVTSVAQLSNHTFDRVVRTTNDLHRQQQTPYFAIEGRGDIILVQQSSSPPGPTTSRLATVTTPPSRQQKSTNPPPRNRPSERWWAIVDGRERGPLSQEEIQSLISDGRLLRKSEVWQEGLDTWTSADSCEALRGSFPELKPALVESVSRTDSAREQREFDALENACRIAVRYVEERSFDTSERSMKYSREFAPYAEENLGKWERAAKLGIPDGMFLFGSNLCGSKSHEALRMEGIAWLEKAAEGGHGSAKRNLGSQLVETGDFAKGVKLLQERADDGDPEACELLADCYLEGKGVTKSRDRFWKWMRLAASYGSSSAILHVKMLDAGVSDLFYLDDE